MVIADRVLSLEEFLRLPERKPALEYEDGEVTQKVSPKRKHSRLQQMLAVLGDRLERATGGAILTFVENRLTVGGRSVVPDVSIFRRERVALDADGTPSDDDFGMPDIPIEVISPRQSEMRLILRCVWYVDNGAAAALLVVPYDRTVLLFRPGGRMLTLRGADAVDLTDVVPGFRLTAAELFDSLRVR